MIMTWCLYALGGGLGHLTRALALARAAIARGHEVMVLTNSADASRIPAAKELGDSGRLITIAAEFEREQVADAVRDRLATMSFDVLIVDTFPRGLAGELRDVIPTMSDKGIKTALVHRDLQPRYVEWGRLDEFARQYDLILALGESGPLSHLPNARTTAPWLIRDAHELLDQPAAWQRLRITETHLPVIAVIASGFNGERPAMCKLASRLAQALHGRANVRLIALKVADPVVDVEAIELWPCLNVLRGIDLLVGAGGYNTVMEAHATQTPLLAITRPRLYDRQDVRLSDHERAEDEVAVEQRVLAWVTMHGHAHRDAVPSYMNGVHDAVRWIESLISPTEHGPTG
jgi:hypothetical protein